VSRREAVDFVDGGITAAAREDSVKSLLDAAVSAITRAASKELPRVGRAVTAAAGKRSGASIQRAFGQILEHPDELRPRPLA
jgi:O-acetyl-ADP-ribose deacetylase (regulator of RNase III)